MSSSLTSFPRGALVGALLMYYFDPRRGRQRRARLRDLAIHLRRDERRLVAKAGRDATNRVHGFVERHRGPPAAEIDDEVLEARVRSQLGRVVSHPRAIETVARGGIVTLRGPILETEVDDTIRHAERVPGVREIVDRLDRHATADHPSLQGGNFRQRGERWSPAIRVAAIAGGAGLAGWGLFARGGIIGTLAAATGGVLVLRGAVDRPISRVGGVLLGREGIHVHKTTTVNAPVGSVFGLWRHVENFPRFMHHVQSVEVDKRDPMRSLWTVDGPGGTPLIFEAMITRLEDEREIEWQTVPGQAIQHSGRVRFERAGGGTQVQIDMDYLPPAGAAGHAVARLLGWDPKARIDDDMVRMKALLEEGRTRAHGEQVRISDLLH